MSRPKKSPKLRHITRMDYERTCGWWVRFYKGQTQLDHKLFSDKKWGGKTKALVAAQQWRDANEAKWVTKRPGLHSYRLQSRRNVTGAIGVALRIQPNRKGMARFSWAALWSDSTSQHTRTFGVEKHGYRRAYQLALDCRNDMLGLPRIEKYPPPLKRVLANRTY